MIARDLEDFGSTDLVRRLGGGGLPPYFLADEPSERDYQEWVDSYWAKDIQELFRVERHASFVRFVELLLVQSGVIFEATRFAAPAEVSRTTITNYLSVLEATRIALVVRPFSTRRSTEIVSAPKVYAFDTGRRSALPRLDGSEARRPRRPVGALRPERAPRDAADARCAVLAFDQAP